MFEHDLRQEPQAAADEVWSLIDALICPEGAARWASRARPSADVVACVAMIDPERLSQSARLDLLLALERQLGWLQARQSRVLDALDGDAPPVRIEPVSVEPDGRLIRFDGRVVGDEPVQMVGGDLADPAPAGLSDESHSPDVTAASDGSDPLSTARGPGSAASPQTASGAGARVERARYEDPHHWIHEEIACALAISSRSAALRVATAVTLVNLLPDTLLAVEIGDLAPFSARLISEATANLDPALIPAFEAAVLPKAANRTPGQLRPILAKARLRAAPAQAAADHAQAVSDRRIVLTPRDDGMAELWALLPADDAQVVYAALTTLAGSTTTARRWSGAPVSLAGERVDDGRTAMQRRVDSLTGLCVDALNALTNVGDASKDANVSGNSGNGCSGGAGSPAGAGRQRRTRPSRGRRRPVVQVTVALSTLLGIDDEPADLAGHGPIPATLARRIASDSSGTWRRLLTDPAGHLVDYGTTRYRPPSNLSDAVTAQYPTCVFPACNRMALRCQLDHRVRATDGGPTDFHNIGPLCSRHHQAKDTLGWTVERCADGSHVWTSPTGRRYRRPLIDLPVDSTASDRTASDRTTSDPPGVDAGTETGYPSGAGPAAGEECAA